MRIKRFVTFKKKVLRLGFLFCLLFPISLSVFAQTPVRHHAPTFIERGQTEVLEFEVQQVWEDQVLEALLFVRSDDRSSFSQHEVQFEGNRARFTFRVDDATASNMEYYFVLHLTDGREIRYPDVQEGQSPIRVDIVEPEESSYPKADFIDYTILSPEPGAVLDRDDILIALTLFYDDHEIEDGTFHLRLNNEDITSQAEISPYLIKYRPNSLEDGEKQVLVTFEKDDQVFEVASWKFRVVGGQQVNWGDFGPDQQRSASGQFELEARNQQFGGINRDALSGRFSIYGKKDKFSYSVSGHLTNQESVRLQPQNRYNADLRYGEWIRLQLGDVYPYFGNLSVSGRRMRGVNTEVLLLDEHLQAQFFMGQMKRGIPNLYQNVEFEEQSLNGEVVDTLFTLEFQDQGRGTFAQNFIGGRLAVGLPDKFQVTFHALKIEDDTTSLTSIRNYRDVLSYDRDLTGTLRPEDKQNLQQNPEKLQINGSNVTPRGNFTAGTEVSFSMDDQRIRFSSEGGFSLLNENIYEGALNRQRAEEMGFVLDPKAEELFDRLSWLIIINENMEAPPFKYLENKAGDLEIETFFPTAALASNSRLDLNYLNNRLQLRYRWIGPDYHTLANSTVRRDLTGINITDRFRIFENRLYLTLGYENLKDNLMNNREATLRTKTYRSSVSWNPVNPDFPRLNLSGRFSSWDNHVPRSNPYVAEIGDDLENAALRNYRIADGDTLAAPFPQMRSSFSFTISATQYFMLFNQNHQFSLNYGLAQTEDRFFSYGDNASQNVSLRLASRISEFGIPFRTHFGYTFTDFESASGLSENRINGMNFGIETFLLDNKCSLDMDLAYTTNRFNSLPLKVNDGGDPGIAANDFFEPDEEEARIIRNTNAFSIHLSSGFDINEHHILKARVNLTNIEDPRGNMESIPNDRILQFRYIYSF